MPDISINEETMKAALKRVILAKIAAKTGTFPHSNHDNIFSPSQWDSDDKVRKTLETSGSLNVTDSAVQVNLSYQPKTL